MPRFRSITGGVPFYREYVQKETEISAEEKKEQLKKRLLSRTAKKIDLDIYRTLQLLTLASGDLLEDLRD